MNNKKYDLTNATVLVTGGAGNIGSYIVDRLLTKNVKKIIVVDNFYHGFYDNLEDAMTSGKIKVEIVDISFYGDLLSVFQKYKPDFVFHQASMLLLDSAANPHQAIQANVVGSFNVISASKNIGTVKKIVFASSASVFGDPRYLPVDESHPFDNKLFYGATKISTEAIFTSLYHEYNLPFVGLRYYNVYSERQKKGGVYTQVLPKWMNLIHLGKPITINDDGSQTMDLIHAEDIADANILAMESAAENQFFNVGSGKETSVLELAELIKRLINKDNIQLKFVPHDSNLVKKRCSSTIKIKEVLKFTPKIDLETGIKRYISHYEKNGI